MQNLLLNCQLAKCGYAYLSYPELTLGLTVGF